MIGLIRNIVNGFRLALFRPVKLWHFCFDKWQATSLMCALIVLSAAVEYFLVGWGARFNHPALGDFLLRLTLALAGFFLIAQFLGYRNNVRFIVVALSSVISVTLIAASAELVLYLILEYTSRDGVSVRIKKIADWLPLAFFIILLIWLVTVVMRTIQISFLTNRVKSFVFSILFFLFLGFGSYALTEQQPLFLATKPSYDAAQYG